MTERLYYHDPYLREFTATVRALDTDDGRLVARLDRTAFYPTSGGQPFDTGALGDAAVVDVIDQEDGTVLHVVDRPLEPGAQVSGVIDWTRRFDHMQQHTGQHILSAAFDRVLKARTESFHLGAEASSIDLDRNLGAAEIAQAEEDANRIVWEDRPVRISFADAEEAAKLPLRKETVRAGTVRLIEVDQYDLSACGGTHVGSSGAVGMIAVTSWERFKGGTRVGFVCGGRALRSHRRLRDVTQAGARILSILPDELPAAIERIMAEGRESSRQVKDLQLQLARHEADALAARSDGGRVVAALDGWDQIGLKTIAAAIAARPGHVAALISNGSPAAIVVARHGAAPVDSAAVLKQVVQKFGGKGGGRPELAQGGGLQGSSDAILAYLRELV